METTKIHQADVTFADGTSTFFVSADGRWFYEHHFPDPHDRTSPLRYERAWLKQAAQGSGQIASVEFTEREAVREGEFAATAKGA